MCKLRIGMSLVLFALLTGCGNSTNTSAEVAPSRTEADAADAAGESSTEGADAVAEEETDATEQEVEEEQTNDIADEGVKTDDIVDEGVKADDIVDEEVKADNADDGDTLRLKSCATYQDILDNAYEVILADAMTDIVCGDELFRYDGIREAKIGRDTNEILAGIGYMYYDVDGNGTDELIIADTGEGVWNNRILLMYTLQDDKPVLLIDGWARNRYYVLNDGVIYNEGSSGAAYTSFGIYRIAEDGNRMETADYYYSGSYGDSVYGWFHNTTGEQTEDESEAVEFEDEYGPEKMMEDYMTQVKELELTFFASMQ